ncbi:hypothetical protein [Flexivirga alba]|uniref:Dihydrofolate reductase n=1 Tax=Flexivirga alba TaxID=702742 RepID=A0ABW2AHG0_9MICO
MDDFEPQTAAGKVLWHFCMSLDGFVAGPRHDMGWMTGFSMRPGLVDEYVTTTGAVLAGRDGFDSVIGDLRPYGGQWRGPILLGDGIRLFDNPGGAPIRLALTGEDPSAAVNLRYRTHPDDRPAGLTSTQ